MSSGPKQQTATNTTKVEYSPQEQAARDQIMNSAMATFHDSNAKLGMGYTGPRPVNASADTVHGHHLGRVAAGQIQQNNANAQQANNFGMHDVLFAESNPYLQSAMDAATRPMIQDFYDAGGVASQTRSDAIQSGSYGGSRQGIAEGLAKSRLDSKVMDTRASMASDAYTKGLDVMQNSIKNQAMLNMMQQLPAQIHAGIGGNIEGYQQQHENYNAAARDFHQNGNWMPLQNLANVIYGGSNGTTTSTSSQPVQRQDNTAQYVGTAASLGMMALMM